MSGKSSPVKNYTTTISDEEMLAKFQSAAKTRISSSPTRAMNINNMTTDSTTKLKMA